MPLDLSGAKTTEAIENASKPETEIGVSATDADGGTVRGEVSTSGSWWSATAWYEWAKEKGRSYGAKAGFKFPHS